MKPQLRQFVAHQGPTLALGLQSMKGHLPFILLIDDAIHLPSCHALAAHRNLSHETYSF
jgi:hypothetical protein